MIFGKRDIVWVGLIACLEFFSCSPRALHEAQDVVAQADSLRAEGQLYTDSARLAQTYKTLGHWQLLYPTDYTHACYHYGRLLREHDNPVDAMQAFIHATHTRTRDYHILGRVYSNMGSICHLASDFPLSYDMYEKSGNCFLKDADTLSYYYLLNDMAFELAEQGKKDSTLCLIHEIEKQCIDKDVLRKTIETKILLYRNIGQYNSVLIELTNLPLEEYNQPTLLTLKADVLWTLEQHDSALIYAKKIIGLSNASMQDKYNMYYIIIHGDSTLSNEEIKILSEQRADLELKNIVPLHKRLAQAVQLLKQDLARKPDWRWLYVIFAGILFVIAFIILYYVWRKRKHHQQIIQDIHEKEQLQSTLSRNISDLSYKKETHHNAIVADMEKLCQSIYTNQDIKYQLCWNNYEDMCESANRYMYNIVKHLQPYHLSEKETRLCILILLKATTNQMVELIPYAKSGIGKFKYTTSQKLGTNTANMRAFMLQLLG